VHGKLKWIADQAGKARPAGFYCHRFVLAADEQSATATALRRVRRNLDKQVGWLSDGAATLQLEADEVVVASIRKLLMPDNQGHSFYGHE